MIFGKCGVGTNKYQRESFPILDVELVLRPQTFGSFFLSVFYLLHTVPDLQVPYMNTLEAKLVGLFDFYSHFSSGFGTDSGTQLEEDCKPIKVEDADGRDFVKLERVDDVVPQLEDEAEKLYRMLDVTKAGLSNYHQFYSHESM